MDRTLLSIGFIMPVLSPLGRARVVAAVALLGLAACQGRTPEPRCPSESTRSRCITEEVCEFDRARDCFVCHCAPPAYYPPRFDPRPSTTSTTGTKS